MMVRRRKSIVVGRRESVDGVCAEVVRRENPQSTMGSTSEIVVAVNLVALVVINLPVQLWADFPLFSLRWLEPIH